MIFTHKVYPLYILLRELSTFAPTCGGIEHALCDAQQATTATCTSVPNSLCELREDVFDVTMTESLAC